MEAKTIVLSVTATIAFLSLILSIYNTFHSVNWQRKERKFHFFSEYTRRYQDIMLHLNSNNIECQESYILLYFDLCSEEYYLYTHNCLPKDVWNMWQNGMVFMMKELSYQKIWKNKGYQSHADDKDFCGFFEHKIIGNATYSSKM